MNTDDLMLALIGAGITDPEQLYETSARLIPTAGRILYIGALLSGQPVEGYVDKRPVPFVETIVKVTRVRPGDADGQKARVWYAEGERETAHGFKDPGYLDTGWLGNELADRVANVAAASVGKPLRMWKRNREDPTGATPAGFRELVWCEPAKDVRELQQLAQEDMKSSHQDADPRHTAEQAVYDEEPF